MNAISPTGRYDPTTSDLYVCLHRARRKSPETWTDRECTRVMTSIMAAKHWSWHVVGITPAGRANAEDQTGARRRSLTSRNGGSRMIAL
jgi:hypothetical protein